MNVDLRFDSVMKRIDVLGRLAFGGQCIAAMAILAGPALFIAASIVPFFMLGDDGLRPWADGGPGAVVVWLGGWLLAAGLVVGGVAFGVFCWRWSGDWITEWPGYAVAFGIAAVANGALAWLMTSSPVPIYLSALAVIGAAFVAGFLVAGHLAGTRVLPETRQHRPRALARRR